MLFGAENYFLTLDTKKQDSAGECWGISAHKNGDCTVMNGEFAGKTLSWCWENHRELFGNMEGDVFPLLIKILGAEDDLSIQVHPNNEYAAEHENGALGKTECWYILDCKENATIVIGHNAKDKEELADMIHNAVMVLLGKPGKTFVCVG